MSKGKGKGFFSKLKKSTIITMVSCGSFVVMTFFALLFFTKFPITLPEKITASLGRESIYRQNNVEGLEVNATTSVSQTTEKNDSSKTTTTQTTEKTTSKRTDFTITITTGKGFRTGEHISTITQDSKYDDVRDSEETFEETTENSENFGYYDSEYDENYENDYSDYDNEYGMNY